MKKTERKTKNKKKLLVILAAVFISVLILCAVIFPFYSAKEATPSRFVLGWEKASTSVIQGLSFVWHKILGKDEADVTEAQPLTENWRERTEPLFTTEPQQTLSAETWRVVEVTYTSEKAYDDPFADVTLDLRLYGNGREYTVPGFWDGDNVWKARFVCSSAGTWQFLTVCSDEENTSLHGKTGEVICSAYAGDLDVYKHGFVTTRYGKRYLTYDDGTPFFYLGDTHWSTGDETVEMVEIISKKRAEQGFTVWQSEPIGEKFDLTDGVTSADLEGLRNYDEKFKLIADAGLTHANAEFFFPAGMVTLIEKNGGYSDKQVTGFGDGKKRTMYDFSDSVKLYLERLSRYWVARYGAFPVMWTLGQEVDNDAYWTPEMNRQWNAANNPYVLVAEYIQKYDPYTQPLTAHQQSTGDTVAYGNGRGTNERLFPYYLNGAASTFREVSAHTFYAAQWSPSLTERSGYYSERDYWYNGQGKPVVNYEGRYCYLWTKNFGSRMQGWASFLTGMCGYGWGGQDTWSYLNAFDEDKTQTDGVDTITSEEKKNATWQDSLEYPSSYQVGYMRQFLEKATWYELVPRFDNCSYFAPCLDVYSFCASNKDNTKMVVYLYSYSDETVAEKINSKRYGGVLTGTVGNLKPRAEYVYQWFDPIHGTYSEEMTFTASATGTWFAGTRPDDTDMVLYIRLK